MSFVDDMHAAFQEAIQGANVIKADIEDAKKLLPTPAAPVQPAATYNLSAGTMSKQTMLMFGAAALGIILLVVVLKKA